MPRLTINERFARLHSRVLKERAPKPSKPPCPVSVRTLTYGELVRRIVAHQAVIKSLVRDREPVPADLHNRCEDLLDERMRRQMQPLFRKHGKSLRAAWSEGTKAVRAQRING